MNLFWRNLLWIILCPGTVTVLLPVIFFIPEYDTTANWGWRHILGLAVLLPGAAILLQCIYVFARDGRGTLSPADPARRLVVKGLYRYSRNPMYCGVMMILAGEAIFFSSIGLSWYAGLVFLLFNLFIRFYEEPYLRGHFGEEYEQYCRQVGRWLPL